MESGELEATVLIAPRSSSATRFISDAAAGILATLPGTTANDGRRKNNREVRDMGTRRTNTTQWWVPLLLAVATAAPARADAPSPVGRWLVQDRRAVIEVYACGPKF